MTTSLRIGLDFGGVIVAPASRTRAGRREDTTLSNPSVTFDEPQSGALEGIARLVEASHDQVWVVSKASPKMQARTLGWLEGVDFCARTGLPPSHVRFCLERVDKGPLCAELGITHFVDDRVHVMQILRSIVPHLYHFGATEAARFTPGWATQVSNWAETVAAILERPLP